MSMFVTCDNVWVGHGWQVSPSVLGVDVYGVCVARLIQILVRNVQNVVVTMWLHVCLIKLL